MLRTIVCISDIHSKHQQIENMPEGDILVVAGDLSAAGKEVQIRDVAQWLGHQKHPHKVVIAGNHDRCLELDLCLGEGLFRRLGGATYLYEKAADVGGVKFYGSPWTPNFLDWSFMAGPTILRRKWSKIPKDTDVLVTHGPPRGIQDKVLRGEHVGCPELLKAVQRIKPKLHVFGHIHESYGQQQVEETLFVNASTCRVDYEPKNPPIVVELEIPERKEMHG